MATGLKTYLKNLKTQVPDLSIGITLIGQTMIDTFSKGDAGK